MLRMEIALFLVMGFIAYVYFSAKRKSTPLRVFFYFFAQVDGEKANIIG